MRHYYLLVACALILAGCDTLARFTSAPQGTYQRLEDGHFHTLTKFELTGNKFITRDFAGETALDYTLEDHTIYMQAWGTQYRFQVVGPDTIRNNSGMGMTGTYLRLK
jgi:hypothetical protein